MEPYAAHAGEGIRQARRDLISEGHVVAGYYRIQMARNSVWSPVRIWRGFGWEPGTHHFRESIWEWRALLNGKQVRIDRVWPNCSWYPISRGEYFYRLMLFRYAIQHEPELPEAAPYQKIDFGLLKFDFAKTKEKQNG